MAQANDAYTAFVSTKFGARGPSTALGKASNALFEDDMLTLSDLEERWTKLQKAQ